MGDLRVPLLGLGAVFASLLLGAAWWGVFAAGIIFVAVRWLPRTAGAIVLLAAPIVLAASLPLENLYDWTSVVRLVPPAVAVAPFFLHLGRALPWRQVPLYLAATAVVATFAFAFAENDVRLALARSDIAVRLQVLLVLVAVLVVDTTLWWRRSRATDRST